MGSVLVCDVCFFKSCTEAGLKRHRKHVHKETLPSPEKPNNKENIPESSENPKSDENPETITDELITGDVDEDTPPRIEAPPPKIIKIEPGIPRFHNRFPKNLDKL